MANTVRINNLINGTTNGIRVAVAALVRDVLDVTLRTYLRWKSLHQGMHQPSRLSQFAPFTAQLAMSPAMVCAESGSVLLCERTGIKRPATPAGSPPRLRTNSF